MAWLGPGMPSPPPSPITDCHASCKWPAVPQRLRMLRVSLMAMAMVLTLLLMMMTLRMVMVMPMVLAVMSEG